MDKYDEIICRCEEVTRQDIEDAIRDGRSSLSGVKKQTRAGMGACQGRTCSGLVRRVLEENGVELDMVSSLDTPRTPIVPVPIEAAGGKE